jgi:hypothetical protein
MEFVLFGVKFCERFYLSTFVALFHYYLPMVTPEKRHRKDSQGTIYSGATLSMPKVFGFLVRLHLQTPPIQR